MECNKEEAIRAKDIAEKKMQSKDFVGARKIALKAQQLFPELENISQMLTVCNVHCSSVVKVAGSELDWYGILQVEQTADEASIKKQYRKLALLLHPDKNNFAGAEAAFKLIGEANRVLTDQSKRSLYDMKRAVNTRTTGARQAPPHMNKNSHARKQPNIQNKFPNDAASQFPGLSQQQTQPLTFWTVCPFCGIRYQYYQSVMNRALRCQNCQKPFIAYAINAQGTQAGANSGQYWNPSGIPQQKEVPGQSAPKAGHQVTAGNSTFCSVSQSATMPESSKAESRSEFGGRSQSRVAEKRAKSQEEKPEEVRKRAQGRKRGRKMIIEEESSESCDTDSSDEDEASAADDIPASQTVETTNNRYPRRSTRQKQQVTYNEDGSDDDFANPPSSKRSRRGGVSGESDDQRQNKEESKEEYADQTTEAASVRPIFEDKKKDKYKGNIPSGESLPNGNGLSEKNGKKQAEVGRKVENLKDAYSSDEDFALNSEYKTQSNSESMTYAEPEFTDFDKDRTESQFAADQIWAAYDTNGCMPRFYARVKRIISEQSKLDVIWLEPCPDPGNQDEVDWVEEELPFACGNFKNGSKGEVDFCSFSYLVSCDKGRDRGSYKIYPRKGDIWALFKDWNIKWSSDPDMHREYFKYEVVQVLSDYDEQNGLKVARMVKLKGFISLFHPTRNKEKDSFQIPPCELLRFSHRIPSCRMTGKERVDVPEGSYELDPASLPTDVEEVEFGHLKSSDDVVVDIECTDTQASGSFSESASDNEKCKKRMHTNKKDIHGRDDTDDRGPSPSVMNGVYEKKRKHRDGGKGNADASVDYRKGESNVTECRAEEAEQIDAAKNGPANAAKSDNSSPLACAGEDFEYPDPEFFVFEADKSEDKFQPGQIWALYSDIDSLPKFYGQIKEVSTTNFKVEITWLDACPLEEEIRWSDKSLPYGCGKFRLGREKETYDTTLTFSHQVRVETTSKNRYSIYPKTGEIWAVYKKLSVDWTRDDLESCGYDIVRVLNNTGAGLRVTFLEKVGGYNSVFKDGGLEMEIPRKEFLRFSHQIPAFCLTEERGGKLRGYLELDPAAIPPILFCTTSN
ncbi:hypothetical protein MRB53_028101 [Persea americana]|uniref:Uncharacterized protein n=1 Tax=Persea americana TaxID=3435 RepID=A0ACC2KEK3_PERAE|nr:hypothetical protein MRB53_028101 [Persea americana]